ncbi:uncharacterized protein LOC141814570 [Curcuma longa]|uniref:uncharacterized protein LOC141814570 n=1 Tax=Curcuma longa TaxID=136217 RepID=UPI003D9ED34C
MTVIDYGAKIRSGEVGCEKMVEKENGLTDQSQLERAREPTVWLPLTVSPRQPYFILRVSKISPLLALSAPVKASGRREHLPSPPQIPSPSRHQICFFGFRSIRNLPSRSLAPPSPRSPGEMRTPETNWERLVRAALRRERLGVVVSEQQPVSGVAGNVPSSLTNNSHVDEILRAADEIEDEDRNIARILCEHAYSLAQNLDPNSEGRGVLQFKTGLMSVIKQKLAKRDGRTIDRSQDIARLQEFYKHYREKNKVDELREDEMKMRESGVLSGNLGEYVFSISCISMRDAEAVESLKELGVDLIEIAELGFLLGLRVINWKWRKRRKGRRRNWSIQPGSPFLSSSSFFLPSFEERLGLRSV